MQTFLDKPQPLPQKVKNILIRSFNEDQKFQSVQHPEIPYILRYSPKYYHSLTIEITPFGPSLSKIKKIKKLKKLKGLIGELFKESFPQKLWFSLIANNRKEMEEAPELVPNEVWAGRSRAFWRAFNVQKMKLFPNVTRIMLSKWKMHSIENSSDPFLTMKQRFTRFLGSLRKLKDLEIVVREENCQESEWVIRKLDKMSILLGRLETFLIKIETQNANVQYLFHNKNIVFHLSGLCLPKTFDPIFAQIPQICKNLNSLSLEFKGNIAKRQEFLNLLASLQHLDKLKKLVFGWPRFTKDFWSQFKPPSNLRQLVLTFHVIDLIIEELFEKDVRPKDAVGHWEEIQELDVLAFNISCEGVEKMIFVKHFCTMILKKIRKVKTLKYSLRSSLIKDDPFFVEEVPHLYESLQRFEYLIAEWGRGDLSRVDLKILKPFRHLKELKLEGGSVIFENIEEVMSEMSALEVKVMPVLDEKWLGETLKKIAEIRGGDKNLRLFFDLTFKTSNFVDLLERLCKDIRAVKTLRGLVIWLVLYDDDHNASPLPVERLKEVLSEYADIQNWQVFLSSGGTMMRYITVQREEAQLYVH